MKYTIPISQEPNQTFNIDLNGQRCIFEFITRGMSLFMNFTLNDRKVIDGMICLNNVNLVQYKEFGFNGKLYFTDTQGNLDPIYYELNDRWLLIYEVDDV